MDKEFYPKNKQCVRSNCKGLYKVFNKVMHIEKSIATKLKVRVKLIRVAMVHTICKKYVKLTQYIEENMLSSGV